MCLYTRYITSRSRVISPYHRERLLVPVKCGRCCECMAEKRNEYYYRIYHQWLDTLDKGGYVFFDTLTYSDEYLPHLSEFIDVLYKTPVDFPCFCYEDVREFMRSLRTQLNYYGYDSDYHLKYFYAAEYGTDYRYTHRPHYHVLFFVTGDIPVDVLRKFVDQCWFFGRTDKVRKFGQHSNYFTSLNKHSELAVSSYVAKYVQKVSKFQHEIDNRIDLALRMLYKLKFTQYSGKFHVNIDVMPKYRNDYPCHVERVDEVFDDDAYRSFCKSQTGKKFKCDLMRLVNQFHRQGKGFGECALKYIRVDDVMEKGYVTMPDSMLGVRKIPLPKYFERKMFETQVTWNGLRVWQPTILGQLFRQRKSSRQFERLSDKYRNIFDELNWHPCNPVALAKYVTYYKGRCNGNINYEPTFCDKLKLPDVWYNYSCPTDVSLLHGAFLSQSDFGVLEKLVPLDVFIRSHVDSSEKSAWSKGFDKILDQLRSRLYQHRQAKQKAFDLKQEMSNNARHSRQLAIDMI